MELVGEKRRRREESQRRRREESHPRREANRTERGPKPTKWRYPHEAKNAAEKLSEQWYVPQMQGCGDVPQEVEEPHDGGRRQKELSPGLYPESCRTETLRWWSKKRNLREGEGGRRHDENPYPPFLQSHQVPPLLPSPPIRRQKRDRRLRQDQDDEGGKGEQKHGRWGQKMS